MITNNIAVTSAAFTQVEKLLKTEYDDKSILGLRVYVEGGGCSGFSYGFTFETDISNDDTVIEKDNIKVIIDPLSIMYLDGSTIDYKKELMAAEFVITNPSFSSTCGCGKSFSM